MKKPIIFLLIVSFILAIGVFFSNPISAQITQQDTQALIAKLQQQIKALQEQVQKLQAEVSSTKTELEAVKTELKFTKILRLGVRDDEVKQLQEFLKQFPDIYPQGLVTGYFGPLTEAAVRKFQEKNDIESIGVVGPKTLSKLNELVTEGAGSSGVIPPGLLTAPGIQKKIEIPSTTPIVAATSTVLTTTPITPTPAQPVTTAPTGVCLIKDRYTDVPRFDVANFGNGFAKYAISGINTVSGLQTACTKTIYDYLLQNYCKSNANPIQRLITTYDYKGIGEPQSLSCGALGCNFIDCSAIASLAPIPNPTPIATTTPTSIPAPTPTLTPAPTPTSTSTPTPTPTPVPAPATTTPTPTPTPTPATTTPTDTGKLIISSISVINITSNSATLTWNTNMPADSRYTYTANTIWTWAPEGLSTGQDTSHSVKLISLSAGTVYRYTVSSKDAGGILAVSDVQTFTSTGGTPISPTDTTPPVISNISVSQFSGSISIIWTTNKPTDTFVEWGTTTAYGFGPRISSYLSTSHTPGIGGGAPIGAIYHFRIQSRDNNGNLTVSPDQTFTVVPY